MKDYRVWELFLNPALMGACVAMASAQIFKAVVKPLFRGKLPDLRKISDYGGFPSGHTAFIAACAAGAGIEAGFRSTLFALAAVTSAILIYDIIKLRKTVDLSRRETDRLLKKAGLEPEEIPPQFKAHSTGEIIGGAVWGIVCAVAVSFIPFPG